MHTDTLNRFVAAVQQKFDASPRTGVTVSAMVGKRYARLVATEGADRGGSALGFVDMTNGDVLKADGWKGPAKGLRGNLIMDADTALGRLSIYGGVR